jgi:hypothetical protein
VARRGSDDRCARDYSDKRDEDTAHALRTFYRRQGDQETWFSREFF